MKKIIFCMQTMVCGGVEKELITILRRFDPNVYDLTVLLLYEEDLTVQHDIPDYVKVNVLNIDKKYYCSGTVTLIKERLKKLHFIEATRIFWHKFVKGLPSPIVIDISKLPLIEESYDYAVCYHMHSPVMLRFVAEKFAQAGKKIGWIHNDFSTTNFPINCYSKWLEKYDRFIGVSNQLTNDFKERCPQFSDRVQTRYNILDADEIREKALDLSGVEDAFLSEKRNKLVTVGRFVYQKGFDIAINAAKLLKDRGIEFCWYAIGYGFDEENMRTLVKQMNVEDVFVILGRKNNPYPYVSMADLYVQPSRHEGFPLTVLEARILSKPIICTDFAGGKEQVTSGVNGYVVEECSAETVAAQISDYISSPEIQERIRASIKPFSQEYEWLQIKEIFEAE